MQQDRRMNSFRRASTRTNIDHHTGVHQHLGNMQEYLAVQSKVCACVHAQRNSVKMKHKHTNAGIEKVTQLQTVHILTVSVKLSPLKREDIRNWLCCDGLKNRTSLVTSFTT